MPEFRRLALTVLWTATPLQALAAAHLGLAWEGWLLAGGGLATAASLGNARATCPALGDLIAAAALALGAVLAMGWLLALNVAPEWVALPGAAVLVVAGWSGRPAVLGVALFGLLAASAVPLLHGQGPAISLALARCGALTACAVAVAAWQRPGRRPHSLQQVLPRRKPVLAMPPLPRIRPSRDAAPDRIALRAERLPCGGIGLALGLARAPDGALRVRVNPG